MHWKAEQCPVGSASGIFGASPGTTNDLPHDKDTTALKVRCYRVQVRNMPVPE